MSLELTRLAWSPDLQVGMDLHSEVHRLTQEGLIPVFTLYLSLTEFYSYRAQLSERYQSKCLATGVRVWALV